MSLTQQTTRRLPTIKKGLLTGLTYEQIGDKIGVTRRTITRDIKTWLESGDFETWLKEEWMRLHNIIIHEDPVEAYRQITKIMSRMVTRRLETAHTETLREIKLTWIKDESNPTSQVHAAQGTKRVSQK